MKKIVAFLMCFIITLSVMPVWASAEVDNSQPIDTDMSVSLTGTNSVGNLLTDALTDELAQQQQNSGNVVYSVEVNGTSVYADISTAVSCKLVVGIYTEDQKQLISSVSQDVTPDDTDIYLTLQKEPPEFFYIKAYLIDSEDLSPVSAVYNGTLYTQEMQEFLSKTTEDFKEEKVVNFDEDTTNNFAVLSDDVTVIEENEYNIITYANLEADLYVIDNIDDTVANLKSGDTFSGTYNGDTIIVKIGEISIEGTTATILGTETDLEAVFDYVKVDSDCGIEEGSVDESTCGEGVTFEGYEEPESTRMTKGFDYSGQKGLDAKFSFDFIKKGSDNNNVSISGNGKLKIALSSKLYISLTYKYVELKLDYHFGGSISVTGKVGFSVPLAFLRFDPVPGICAEMTPSFVGSFSGTFEIGFLLKGTVGFGWYSDVGFVNLTGTPKFEVEVKGEITIFLGLQVNPTLKVLEGYLCEATLESNLGAEAKATLSANTSDIFSSSMRHDCKACVKGEIYGKFDLSIKGKLLKNKKWKLSWKLLEKKIKLFDFYWSIDRGEFGWRTCPHKSYKLTVTVLNKSGEVVPNAQISVGKNELLTDKGGNASVFLPNGNYKLTVAAENYKNATKQTTIKDAKKSMKIFLNFKLPLKTCYNRISLGYNSSAAIKENGDLYIWGRNYAGQLGGTGAGAYYFGTPRIIMSNVAAVSLGWGHSAAITKTGDLYMWGGNSYGQIGDGTTNNSLVPKKIMSDVVEVSLGAYHSAAITRTGDLYMWGDNEHGQIGNNTTTNCLTPQKIMSNIARVSLGTYHSAVLVQNGDIYLWGWNHLGSLGDGTSIAQNNVLTPKKIFNNPDVVDIDAGRQYTGALTKGGDLYLWGNNYYAQIGDGTSRNYVNTPKIIMSNVVDFNLGQYHSAAITENGDLYLWGTREDGRIGDGTINLSLCYTPKKIMNNIAEVSLGGEHSAAITNDGELYLWGSNSLAEVGISDIQQIHARGTPTYLMNLNNPSGAKSDGGATKGGSLRSGKKSGTEKTETFGGLAPDTIYNYYVLKDKNAENPLDSENILYLDQSITGEEGNLEFTYSLSEENSKFADTEGFVVAFKNVLPDYLNAGILLSMPAADKIAIKLNNADYEGGGFSSPYIMATVDKTEYTVTEYTADSEYIYFEINLEAPIYDAEYSITLYAESDSAQFKGKEISGNLLTLRCDLSSDEFINSVDAILLIDKLLEDDSVIGGDINADCYIDIRDLIKLKKILLQNV